MREGGVVDDSWFHWNEASLLCDGDEVNELRACIVPDKEWQDIREVYTGPILWTNLPCEPLVPEGYFGSPVPWFPASPVPGDMDLWPGELPFTAFGQFGPDALDLRVFDQGVYWVNRYGVAVRVEDMCGTYRSNVIAMLTGRASEFYLSMIMRERFQSAGDSLLGRTNGARLSEELGIGSLEDVEPSVWLASTPLMRALIAARG